MLCATPQIAQRPYNISAHISIARWQQSYFHSPSVFFSDIAVNLAPAHILMYIVTLAYDFADPDHPGQCPAYTVSKRSVSARFGASRCSSAARIAAQQALTPASEGVVC